MTLAVAVLSLLTTTAIGAEPDWDAVRQAAVERRPERPLGDRAVLDALERRARVTLDALEHPVDRQEWSKSVPELRRRLRTSVGLDRLPEPVARNVRNVGIVDRGDYVIETLTYETFDETPVPAHVYRRKQQTDGRRPAVLFVPGHWWQDSKARPNFQACCINLARWGFIVLTYDPIGQGERGVSFRDHRRTELLLSGVSQQAVTAFESACALQYLRSQVDVDAGRIGITGASGGGYNSWIMAALDEKIAVSVPVVGTSDFYEQLRVCRTLDWYRAKEHCHFVPDLLRYANNHEFVALIAPRPVLVISARSDQSFPIPGIRDVVGYGRTLYGALGARERISYFEDDVEAHGYQRAKREAAYGWLRHWLQGIGTGNPIPEPETVTLPEDAPQLRCFPEAKRPAGPGLMHLAKRLAAESVAARPARSGPLSPNELAAALGVGPQAGTATLADRSPPRRIGDVTLERLTWTTTDSVTLPMILVRSNAVTKPRGLALAAADAGKESLLNDVAVRTALANGDVVALVDVRGVGELQVTQPGWTFATSLLIGENFVGRQALDLCELRRGLAASPEFCGLPIGLLGSGPYCSWAAAYAATFDAEFAWTIAADGFVAWDSFLDRPESLPKSYTLHVTRDTAWDDIDREIPHALFVFDALRKFDLCDVFAAPKSPVLVARPIDGDWKPLADDSAVRGLWSRNKPGIERPAVAIGKDAETRIAAFVRQAAARGR